MKERRASRRPGRNATGARAYSGRGLALALGLLACAIPPLEAQANASQAANAAPANAPQANAPQAAAYRGLSAELLASIRDGFYLAEESMDATLRAIAFMEAKVVGPVATWPGVARAYRASLQGLVGKHDARLTVKFKQVSEAIEAFDGLAEAFPTSLEIRFLRYAFYSQLPLIFGVGGFVKPDLEAIIAMLEAGSDPFVPAAQQTDMADWLLGEAKLDQAERRRVTAARAALAARR